MAACANQDLEELVASRFRQQDRWHYSQQFAIYAVLGAIIWVWTSAFVLLEFVRPAWLLGATLLAGVLTWHGHHMRLGLRRIRGNDRVALFLDEDGDVHWCLGYPAVCCDSNHGIGDYVLVIDVARGKNHHVVGESGKLWRVADVWASFKKGLRICLQDHHDQELPALPPEAALKALGFYNVSRFCYQGLVALEQIAALKRSERRLRGMRNEALALLMTAYENGAQFDQKNSHWRLKRCQIGQLLGRIIPDATIPPVFQERWAALRAEEGQ